MSQEAFNIEQTLKEIETDMSRYIEHFGYDENVAVVEKRVSRFRQVLGQVSPEAERGGSDVI